LIVTNSQLTMTVAPAPLAEGSPTAETLVATEIESTIPDCDWEWKFSAVVDSICADYGTLPSFTSFSWD
jgi:hypothetical protein